jgi:hypothetical protein
MSLDNLLKGFAVFKEGLKDFAVAKGVNDANEQLAQLNQMELAKEEKLAATTQISNSLAMRLGAAGADAAQVESLAGRLAPSAGAQYQAGQNKEMQSSSQSFQGGENEKDRQLQRDLAQMKNDALGLKNPEKEKKLMAGFADKFRKENKTILESRDQLGFLKEILDKTPDRVGIEMAKTGLLKASGEGRVSDADVIRAQRDPSLRAGIARKLKLEATGEALADDRKFYQMILTHVDKKLNETLKKKVKGYSEGAAELADVDGARLESGLRKQLNLSDDAKTVVGKQYNQKMNKTKLKYSDGSEEIVDGRQ